MSWTKRQLITAAYRKLGIANYDFDLTPEQLQSACVDMDSLIASWEADGVHIGYASSDAPSTVDIDSDSGVPAYCNLAIYLNLAMLLAADYGKNITPDFQKKAEQAYKTMLLKSMPPVMEYQMPSTMPRGAGQKNYDWPYVNPPTDPLETGPEGEFEFYN